MLCNGYTKVWQLAPGELVQLDGARGTVLRVTRGTLWMTLERDPRDIVLEAGNTFTIDRGGLTLIQAQRETTVCVLAHHVDEVRSGTARAGVLTRLRAWLGAVAAAGSHRTWAPYV
jgi:Protein of unknown function (DUF2917)